ncbi:hypothetical protein AAHC03_05888 [Spirometra sp. Aus1]
MSKLHAITAELGAEVDRFTARIEEEKRKILESKALFESQLEKRRQNDAESAKLLSELDRIQTSCFKQRPSPDSGDESGVDRMPYLVKVAGEIRAAAQKIRDERIEVLAKYKAQLDKYELLTRKNHFLESFIETWKSNLRDGKELTGLKKEVCSKPGPQMTSAPPPAHTTRASEMSNVHAQSLAHAEVTTPDPRKMSDQSSYSANGDGNDFSRLIDLNSTTVANLENGILSNETLSELMQVDNRRMEHDETA